MVINERINFKRILCPNGLTPDSDEALRYAIALAKAYRAKLFVLNCAGVYQVASLTEQCLIEGNLIDRINKHLFLPAATEVIVVEGGPADVIVREAAERRIDLIVMRSHRRP